MSASLEVKGMDEILERLQEMGRVGKKIKDKVLIKAAAPILADMVATTAFKDTTGVNGGRGRKGLSVARPRSKGDTEYVLIGIDKADISEIFYMKMVNWGTSKMVARPFMAPAFYKNKIEAFNIIRSELKRELGL